LLEGTHLIYDDPVTVKSHEIGFHHLEKKKHLAT